MDYFDFSGPNPPKGPLILSTKTCPSLTPAERRLAERRDPD
jgi:hypothetical protein